MRDSVPRSDALAEGVAQAARGWAGERERKPGAKLTLGSGGQVTQVGMRRQQTALQASQGVERQRVWQRMVAAGEQRLDGVIDSADPGRQPQVWRRVQR